MMLIVLSVLPTSPKSETFCIISFEYGQAMYGMLGFIVACLQEKELYQNLNRDVTKMGVKFAQIVCCSFLFFVSFFLSTDKVPVPDTHATPPPHTRTTHNTYANRDGIAVRLLRLGHILSSSCFRFSNPSDNDTTM
jgi:hypothetical protein